MLEFNRDTWHGCFLQNITVWIDYLSRTNPSHRSFFPMLSLLMLWLVNALCNLLLNYWVLSSFYYVWLICIHIYSSQVLLCPLVLLYDLFFFHAFTRHQEKFPIILFCFLDHILSCTLLYLWYSFLYVCRLQGRKTNTTMLYKVFP